MVDQQEFHHAFAGFLDHRRVGEDFRKFAVRAAANIAHAHGAGCLRLRRAALYFNQAHAAIAGHRQSFMEAEARNFGAGFLARLDKRVVIRNFDLFTVNLQFSHRPLSPISRLQPNLAADNFMIANRTATGAAWPPQGTGSLTISLAESCPRKISVAIETCGACPQHFHRLHSPSPAVG
ncbi:hypothetical protein RHSP_16860 [Rhizobium freirei PRF 81]|uniref:Uncharacterized protein n=1 Tax=Rhizobium freirei PRF 81 TaxID=363754 RepID=N6V4F6_9HYPH|nr:hypothetical protein RHSP_16860 [Rhizobium freirei PRF 81]